jgi:hypothetical protein
VLEGFLQFSVVGVWSLKVQTNADAATVFLFLNGQQIPLDASTQIAAFTLNATGKRNELGGGRERGKTLKAMRL